MTYNTISQNNDDHFYTAVCAYVHGEGNGIVPGTVGEEQAEIAKRLLQDNPAILDDKDRLLAEIATIHYREIGLEAREALDLEERKNEDDLFADLAAYVRGQPHKIPPGTIHKTWAEQAKQLAAEDPTTISEMLGVRFEAGFRYGHSQALGDERVYPPTLVEIGLKIKPKG
jgi:hypothetical protein